jgi:hypothetical protein
MSEIPEFEYFRNNHQIRDAIYSDRGLDGLADFLQKQVLNTYNPHSHLQTKTPLPQQLANHYTSVQIAQAWLMTKTQLIVSTKSLHTRLKNNVLC